MKFHVLRPDGMGAGLSRTDGDLSGSCFTLGHFAPEAGGAFPYVWIDPQGFPDFASGALIERASIEGGEEPRLVPERPGDFHSTLLLVTFQAEWSSLVAPSLCDRAGSNKMGAVVSCGCGARVQQGGHSTAIEGPWNAEAAGITVLAEAESLQPPNYPIRLLRLAPDAVFGIASRYLWWNGKELKAFKPHEFPARIL